MGEHCPIIHLEDEASRDTWGKELYKEPTLQQHIVHALLEQIWMVVPQLCWQMELGTHGKADSSTRSLLRMDTSRCFVESISDTQ